MYSVASRSRRAQAPGWGPGDWWSSSLSGATMRIIINMIIMIMIMIMIIVVIQIIVIVIIAIAIVVIHIMVTVK